MDCSPSGFSIYGILQARILRSMAKKIPKQKELDGLLLNFSHLPAYQVYDLRQTPKPRRATFFPLSLVGTVEYIAWGGCDDQM